VVFGKGVNMYPIFNELKHLIRICNVFNIMKLGMG